MTPPPSMSVELRFEGQSMARGDIAAGPGPIAVTLPILREAADRMLAQGARRAGVASACQPGCAACCRQLVPLAAAEARDLRERVANMPEALRTRIEARFSAAADALERSGLMELMADPSRIPPEGLEELGLQYLAAGIDCPFLEDERCAIYAHRPMACRQHAVSSDAAECRARGERVRRIAPRGRAMNAALDAAAGTAWVPLVLCLEQSASDPGDERTPAAWLAGIWRAATRGAGEIVIS